MKKFAYALILSTAIMSAPAMANDETQHNTHGRYSYYASDAHYSDIARLDRHNVMNIQTALHEAGYNTGPIDGVIGHQTRRALKQFQKDHSLQGNGEITERTLKALDIPGTPKKYRRARHYN